MKVSNIIQRTVLGLAYVAGFILMLVALVVVADISLRYAVSMPITGALELTELSLVFVAFLGLAYTQSVGGHIDMDTLYQRLSQKVQNGVRAFAIALSLLVIGVTTLATALGAIDSIQTKQATYGLFRFPLWPSKVAIAVGFLVLGIYLVYQLILTVKAIRSGRI